MPVIMMTSVDTLYEVTSQDTNPINRLGAPGIESSFNGLTQMVLQSPNDRIQNRALAESAFEQQQKYLSDAAQVAVNIFNPLITSHHRFRSTLKLTAITGQLQPFDLDSESSGLAYTLALALNWGDKKGLFKGAVIPDMPIFATGCVPIDCYAKPIGHLIKKIRYACHYIERLQSPKENTLNNSTTNSTTQFYILIPKGNLQEYQQETELHQRVEDLGGRVVGIKHISEALQHIMGDAFDGGIFTNINNGFSGLQSISYEQRHLFMGRELLVKELFEKSQTAIEQSYVLNVTGVSGSGKSSSVMAGLVPTLLSQAPESSDARKLAFNPNWTLLRPSQLNTLDDLLSELLGSLCKDSTVIEHCLSLKNNPQAITTVLANYLSNKQENEILQYERTLWVLDQYEELFTHSTISPTEAQTVFSLLATFAEQLPLLIITILRTEYLGILGGQASTDVQLPRRIQPKEIERIIALQLQYHRLSTESAQTDSSNSARAHHLENRIKNDAIGKPLTTVSYLLQQMHHQMIAENASSTLLTHQHYEILNGIEGVMSQQAELAITQGLHDIPEDQHALIIDGFFEAFVNIDNEQQAVARALENTHISDYPEGVNALIDAFMSKGLIIDCGRSHTPKIKLAHDTLLPNTTLLNGPIYWERLFTWFTEKQDFLLWRQTIEPLFLKWRASTQQNKQRLLLHTTALKTATQQKVSATSNNQALRDYLQQSHRALTQKRFTPIAIIGLLCALIGLGVWHQYFRIHSQYVSFIGDRYGIPFGVTPLTTTQKESRQFHYRLDYQAGRLLRLSRHNSHGALKNDVNRENAARWHYHYTETGDLLREESFAQNGKSLSSKTYAFTPAKNIAQVRYKFHGTQKTIGDIAYQASSFEGDQKNKSQITQHKLAFDHTGLITTRLFFNNNEQAVKDATGAYGLQYDYNDQGLIIRLQYIGIDGDSISINGVHTRIYTRDKYGNISAKSWLDQHNKLILNKEGYARTTTTYDKHGNLIEKKYLESDTLITVHKDGFSRATARYDSQGNQIEQQFLDQEGNATLHKWGFARVTLTYDDRGNVTQWRYFDANNQPTLRNNRFSRIHFTYDDLGNKTGEHYFGLNNTPVLHQNGYARYTAKYDQQGNRLEEAYFDIDDKAIANKRGYARIRSIYDDKNNLIQRAYFGIKDEPIVNQYGYAYYKATFDKQGNRTHVYFYGMDDKLRNNHYGFAHIALEFNEQGHKTVIAYYDANEQPTLHQDGIAKTTLRYDTQGNILEAKYYDTNNQPALRHNSFARISLGYDNRGNRIEERYYGTNDTPTLTSNGYARQHIIFDKRNNPIEWQFFGIDDAPIANKHGYARITAEYDVQDKLIGSAYFDTNDNFLKGKGSFAK
jgi:YD repeat-containing protein